ncbi:hypothetical protein AMTR_s02509p00006430 [Amborella trichopoda]|uniref:Uncharacterized protein n=1 Tax=Amborella trichopoda TaxID=13333 RepID=U5D0P4_AMBTC|nr:hypothetical protein AMTR_s02509p00006430 [Amborella trichopoda]
MPVWGGPMLKSTISLISTTFDFYGFALSWMFGFQIMVQRLLQLGMAMVQAARLGPVKLGLGSPEGWGRGCRVGPPLLEGHSGPLGIQVGLGLGPARPKSGPLLTLAAILSDDLVFLKSFGFLSFHY